ncbi:large ribosomal subunit protein bL20m [Sinocyclocheilus grahami]|uniref:large ribosomal subunit protein bL20m n=1 Tax=Sinocyclocheilus grahami TaxID=75366 RepID=UPI0007ACC569|nr:PREDICTED: 39S ribosomal protein L20, mitochondrial [Sinocyclocheilus grahami]
MIQFSPFLITAGYGVCFSQHFRGRKNRCYSLAVRAVRRAFVYASKARKVKRHSMRQLWIQRIAAASREQHMKYPALIHNLLKVRDLTASSHECV